MKFSPKVFFAYDSTPLTGRFDEFFEGMIRGDQFAVSGLEDLRFHLLMTEEYQDACSPKLKFLEKEPTAPGIFRDGDGNPTTYTRKFEIPCSVKESERKFIWRDGQSSYEQPFSLWVSPLTLARLDYYPSAGDLFKWRDTWRQITATKIDPSDYFGTTGFPLYIHINSALWTPEVGLDGTISCGPEGVSVVLGRGPSRLMPVSDTASTVVSPSALVAPAAPEVSGCDCPIKTPRCYTRECNYYQ